MLSTALTEDETRTLHKNYLHLHAHPELSMAEHATAQYIQERLNELGIENFISGGTGVVGIQRNGDGPVIAFRADSDRPAHQGRHRRGLRLGGHRFPSRRHRGAGDARLRP